jgi:hypothetical protein
MKVNFPHLAALIFSILLGIYAILYLTSCSPQFHHDKAVDKGYVYSCDTTTVIIRDTIKGKDGKDSIVERFVNILIPTATPPLTRYQIRYKYKTEKIYVKQAVAEKKIEAKQIKETTKKEKKTRWKLWLLIGFSLGLLITKLFHDFKGMFNLPIQNR